MKIQKEKLKDKLLFLALSFCGIAILIIIFHRPETIESFVRMHIPSGKAKTKDYNIPQIPKLDSYLSPLANKSLFLRITKGKTQTGAVSNLDDYEFNGIIKLDTTYVAIYKKSTKEQYLVPVGSVIDGIKIKNIEKNIIILDVNGEEQKIFF